MLKFAIKRILVSISTLLAIITLVFSILYHAR